jgi:hypothetical protein
VSELTVRNLSLLVALLLVAITSSTWASDVDLIKGRVKRENGYITQAFAVKNGTSTTLQAVFVECGFWDGEEATGAGAATLANIAPGQTVANQVVGEGDRTDCRVVWWADDKGMHYP